MHSPVAAWPAVESKPDFSASTSAASEVLSLQQACMSAAEATLQPTTVCAALAVADLVRPSANPLRAAALAFLACHLPLVLAVDKAGAQALSFDCMVELLQHSSLVAPPPLVLLPPLRFLSSSYIYYQQVSSNVARCDTPSRLQPPRCFGMKSAEQKAQLMRPYRHRGSDINLLAEWLGFMYRCLCEAVLERVTHSCAQACTESVVFETVASWATCDCGRTWRGSTPITDSSADLCQAAASAAEHDDHNPRHSCLTRPQPAASAARESRADCSELRACTGGGSPGHCSSKESVGACCVGCSRILPALDQLLPLVRFPLMDNAQLATLWGHPLVTLPGCTLQALLQEAADWHDSNEVTAPPPSPPRPAW